MHPRRWSVFGSVLVIVLALATSAPAAGDSRGPSSRPRGAVTASYRTTAGPTPRWVATAERDARAQLRTRGSTLTLDGADQDSLAMTHVRFDQIYRGLPVFGGQLVAHLDASGQMVSQSGRVYPVSSLRIRPAISAGRAIAIAESDLGYPGRFAQRPTAELVVLPLGARRILSWHVSLWIEDGTPATAHHEYYVDARTGRIAWYYDSLPMDGIASYTPATGTGNSLYSGTVSLNTMTDGVQFGLADSTRGSLANPSRVKDMNNSKSGSGTLFVDADDTWGNGTTSSRQTVAVDAAFGATETWDYYLTTFGRRGIDGNGYTMVSRVHYGSKYNNAFWDGTVMSYGDGDGVTFGPLVSLDVAGHEITHGLTQYTANLTYARESGALNEAFSDIFGTAVEFYAGGAGGRPPDYQIGEDFDLTNDTVKGIRNMADPTEDRQPDNYANRAYKNCLFPRPLNDNCGVHTNSGIANNAFYLLAEGGTNKTSGRSVTGIGRLKAEAIFYRALTLYLTPSSTFSSARQATISAAKDLYGASSAEQAAVASAWTAVGVN